MKIGINTQPLTTNYGGILQNYALQTTLRRMGHEVWTFDVLKYTWIDWSIETIKTIVKRILSRDAQFPQTPIKRAKKERPLRIFAYKNINLTKRVKKITWGHVQLYNMDALVVGSDQVWRPIYNFCIEDMFLRYADGQNIKKVAYAASFGTDQWEFSPFQTKECANLAKQFKAISVREDSGIDLCKEYLCIDATHVLDPTFLLRVNDYSELCKHISKRDAFVFAYILDTDKKKVTEIKAFAKAKELPYLIKSADTDIEDTDSIELWLSYFRDAAYIITDSFHGTALSIIYNKEFFVFGNEKRGNSRFDSLLNLFDLKQRVVKSVDPGFPSIDWKNVNVLLDSERQRCYEWLERSLS